MFKQIKKLKGECPICEAIKPLSYGTRIETLTINKQHIPVTSKVYYCQEGKHYFYNPIDEENKFQDAYREYRKQNRLLQSEEIKEIREKYGLSRKAFARFLGWGEITIQRYETGAIQDNAHNILLLFIKDESNFEKLFEIRKSQLEPKDVATISKKLEEIKHATLKFAFKESKWLAEPRRLIHFPDVQYREYIYHKPSRTNKGELELAS